MNASVRRVMLCLLLLLPARAFADAESDQWIEQGLALREKGKDAEALALFEKAHARSPSPRALAQIALAEQALGRFLLAEKHLASALESKGDPWISSRKGALETALAAIGKRLARVTVTSNVGAAKLQVNGQDARLGAPVRVAAGKVKLDLSAPGYAPVSRTIDVAGEAQHSESISLSRAGGAVAAKPAEARPAEPKAASKPEPKVETRPETKPETTPETKPETARPEPDPLAAPPDRAPEPDLAAARPPPTETQATLRTLGWVSAGVGAGALALGVILVATSGGEEDLENCELDPETFELDCSSAGQVVGVISLVTAGLLGATGAGLLIAGYSDSQGPQVSFDITPSGALGRLTF